MLEYDILQILSVENTIFCR